MKIRSLLLASLVVAILALALSSCRLRTADHYEGHIYYHPQHDTPLYYDSEIRVYRVRNRPNCYYYDGYYYRYDDGYWYYTPHIYRHKWRRTHRHPVSVPNRLLREYNRSPRYHRNRNYRRHHRRYKRRRPDDSHPLLKKNRNRPSRPRKKPDRSHPLLKKD